MPAKFPLLSSTRQAEIVAHFQQVLDEQLTDFLAGRVTQLPELRDIAAVVCLHPGHLSQVIKQVTGQHACHFYQQRLLREAKHRLATAALPIKFIAHQLDYDESNFTKFFKRFTGLTPSQYRKSLAPPVG